MLFSTWGQWLKGLARQMRRQPRRSRRRLLFEAEKLEDRVTPSAGVAWPTYIRLPLSPDFEPQAGPLKFKGAFTPAGMQLAYGIDKLIANANDGTGQTIAVIDAYDNPAFSSSGTPGFVNSDLHFFDQQFGLPDPVFVKVAQDGSTSYPRTDPS